MPPDATTTSATTDTSAASTWPTREKVGGTPRRADATRPDSSRVPYLPGLDGMRALAVVAVMVYHANSSWLKGGFLGVEVFFVIEGGLILYDDDGNYFGYTDAQMALDMYYGALDAAGIPRPTGIID